MQIMVTITQNNRNPEMLAAVRRDSFLRVFVNFVARCCGAQMPIRAAGAAHFRHRLGKHGRRQR